MTEKNTPIDATDVRIFPAEEFAHRVQRATALMREQKFDGLLATGDFSAAMNYFYLSGHVPRDYQSNFSRPHCIVLTQDGQAALLVYGVNAENARDMSWVQDISTYAPPFSADALVTLLRDLGLANGRIGAELGTDSRMWLPYQEFRRLEEALPRAAFVDASRLFWQLRQIKSPAEIALIRHADEINGRALTRLFANLSPGVSEQEIVQRAATYLVEEGAYRPPHTQLLVVSAAKARSMGHRSRMLGPTHHTLETGDTLFIDSGVIHQGYWGEFNRMGVVDVPNDRQLNHHRAIRQIVQRSIHEAIKPGTSFRQVMTHMVSLYQELGFAPEQYARYTGQPFMHLCHGIGLNGSEPPFVRMDSDELLQPGMVMSVEAYLHDDGVMYGSEEDIVVTSTGVEILSDIDTGLYIIGTTERAG